MRRKKLVSTLLLGTFSMAAVAQIAVAGGTGRPFADPPAAPTVVGDLIWAWGNPGMTEAGAHTVATYAQASPAQRARLLGAPNVIMAGHGLPNNDALADRLTREVLGAKRIVWEIMADGTGGPPFVYTKKLARLRHLVDKYPTIEAVLLDDMSTVAIDKGFKPEHIRRIRALLPGTYRKVKIWGVVYTMSLDRPKINEYIKELDVIFLAEWHARKIVDLEKNVARCKRLFPHKPIILGLYLYDYGAGRRIPHDLLERQCKTALKLARAGLIEGIEFTTINNDPAAIAWTADWIRRVSSQPLRPATTKRSIKIDDGHKWHLLGGPWSENKDGVIQPPDKRNLHSRAFYTADEYADLTAEFEFNGNYRETGTGAAGFVFRAKDANHFYMVYFPWGGQQLRAKHFWAQIVKVDGDGYLRGIKSAWVPGVTSETDRWYKVRLEVSGPVIQVWVDGRHALRVRDKTFQRGAIGLAGYGWYFFRNIMISGKRTPLEKWDFSQQIPVHHFTVGLPSENMPSGCVAPNGDVLLAAGHRLVRSTDRGRTWSEPETLPDKLGTITDYGNTIFRTAHGRLIAQLWRDRKTTKKPVPDILIAESKDNGRTWSDPVPSKVAGGWPKIPANLTCYGPLVETADGTLLRFQLGRAQAADEPFSDVRTWGAIHCKAFAVRSTDGGKSWSAPIELDRPAWCNVRRGSIPGSLDFTEPTGVAIGNKVTVLIRPVYSPMMWQCWSDDAGASWDAAVRATFPGYAQSMVRTRSGAILCAHRYPQYAVNASYDNGLNWGPGTIIDYPAWAMGCLVEVEPDVVLCTYMNAARNMPLLAQLLRVTPQGIRPVSR